MFQCQFVVDVIFGYEEMGLSFNLFISKIEELSQVLFKFVILGFVF